VKELVLEMFGKFHRGGFNISRLTYGLISLIPKIKEANTIKQFSPIFLLGVDYKWFTKVLTNRVTKVIGALIRNTHTSFILGRNILEGVVILHVTIHELKRKKTKRDHFKAGFWKIIWQSAVVFPVRGAGEEVVSTKMDRMDLSVSFRG
jgi:hypothetical protein